MLPISYSQSDNQQQTTNIDYSAYRTNDFEYSSFGNYHSNIVNTNNEDSDDNENESVQTVNIENEYRPYSDDINVGKTVNIIEG